MTEPKTSSTDFGLLYLSNFERGLSYYQWDRKIIYDLKSNITPNNLIADYLERKLVELEIRDCTKYYVLTNLGKSYCEQILKNYHSFISFIQNMITKLEEGFRVEQVTNKLPIISFYFKHRKYKLILEKSNKEEYLRVFLTNNLEEAINEFRISLEGIEKSDYLKNILMANMKYIDAT